MFKQNNNGFFSLLTSNIVVFLYFLLDLKKNQRIINLTLLNTNVYI